MSLRFNKQPSDVLDYDFDFTEWFAGRADTIASYVAVVEDGLSLVTHVRSDMVVKVVVGGGDSGSTYKVTVRITSVAGLVKEVDIFVRVKEI